MKKKILITILIILIIAFITTIVIVVNHNLNDNDNQDNMSDNDAIENDTKEYIYGDIISEERLKELFDNSYKYYLLYQGKEETNGEIGNIELEGVKYTKFNSLNTIEEIENMINNTFVEGKRLDYYDKIFTNRAYIEVENGLYVDYKEHCKNIEISFEDVIISKVEDNLIFIDFTYTGVNAYYENDDWYLDGPLHFCSQNKESTE